mgnify:CR=1 FL=1
MPNLATADAKGCLLTRTTDELADAKVFAPVSAAIPFADGAPDAAGTQALAVIGWAAARLDRGVVLSDNTFLGPREVQAMRVRQGQGQHKQCRQLCCKGFGRRHANLNARPSDVSQLALTHHRAGGHVADGQRLGHAQSACVLQRRDGVGHVRAQVAAQIEQVVVSEGQTVLGWRMMPVNESSLGSVARANRPAIRQRSIELTGARTPLRPSAMARTASAAGS